MYLNYEHFTYEKICLEHFKYYQQYLFLSNFEKFHTYVLFVLLLLLKRRKFKLYMFPRPQPLTQILK